MSLNMEPYLNQEGLQPVPLQPPRVMDLWSRGGRMAAVTVLLLLKAYRGNEHPLFITYNSGASQLTSVVEMYASGSAFAFLKQNGYAVTMGYNDTGGQGPTQALGNNIVAVFATLLAFSLLKDDNTFASWGAPRLDPTPQEINTAAPTNATVNDVAFAVLFFRMGPCKRGLQRTLF
jgi:hypothetical protein